MSQANNKMSLYAIRINSGMTRQQVSDKTGISYFMLGRYERGVVEPRASDLQKLCSLYNVPLEIIRF